MYKVIRYFRDAQDNRHAYNVGDIFPHDGRTISEQRINALISGNNMQEVPLIKYVPDEAEKPVKKESKPKKEEKAEPKKDEKAESKSHSKDDIKNMPFFKLKSVAKEYGIDVKDKKADEIRSELMEKL